MLPFLGVIFYLVAVASIAVALLSLGSPDGVAAFEFSVGMAGAISSAFFGAMCFAADAAITLLKQIAGASNIQTSSPQRSVSEVPFEGQVERDPESESRLGLFIVVGAIALIVALAALTAG